MALTAADHGGPRSFYLRLGDDRFLPTAATASPWNEHEQHGGPPSALLARAIERRAVPGETDWMISRLTVEFLGPIPRAECAVETEVIRDGRRIELVDARLIASGRRVALARAWRALVRPDSTPERGEKVAVPPIPSPQPQRYLPGVAADWGYGRAVEWRFVEGAYDRLGPATVWTRVRLPLVEGEETSPLQRMAIVADSANGLSAELDLDRWLFVPTSISFTLNRRAAGEWLLLDARSRTGSDGIGVARADMADEEGELGVITQSLFVTARRS